jgi:Spy/CpxP family protein refolding chaperone
MQARWGHARRMRMHRQFMLARLVRNPSVRTRLGITPEQALKIRTQTSDFRKTQIRNRAELQVKHLELHDLMSADKPDRSAIDKKLQEISAVQLARARSAIDFRLAMREALTPDQKEKLREMRAEFFRQRGPGHQGSHGPMGEAPSPDA